MSILVSSQKTRSLYSHGRGLLTALFLLLMAHPASAAPEPFSGVVYVTSEKEAGEDVNGDGRLEEDVDFMSVVQLYDAQSRQVKTIGAGYLDVIEGENNNISDGKVVYIGIKDQKRPVMVYDIKSGESKNLGFEGRNAAISGKSVLVNRLNEETLLHELVIHDLETGVTEILHQSSNRIEADIDEELVSFITRPNGGEDWRLYYRQLGENSSVLTEYLLANQVYAPSVSKGRIAYVTMLEGKRRIALIDTQNGTHEILPVEPFDTKVVLRGDLLSFTVAVEKEADIRAFSYDLKTEKLFDTGISTRRARMHNGYLLAVEGVWVRTLGELVLMDLESGRQARSAVKAAPHFGFAVY